MALAKREKVSSSRKISSELFFPLLHHPHALSHSRPYRESPCQVGMRNEPLAKRAGWFGGLDLRTAAGAGVLGFPVMPDLIGHLIP